MNLACPYCGADVIEGADVCDECQHSLTDMSLPSPRTEVESGLLRDRLDTLKPNPPSTVTPDAKIGDVLRKMVDESIGCVMVVENDELVGIFSERDAMMRVNVDAAKKAAEPIRTVMTPDPATLRVDNKIAYALHRMDVGGYRHIPVLDETDRLIGVVSIRDILGYLTERGAATA